MMYYDVPIYFIFKSPHHEAGRRSFRCGGLELRTKKPNNNNKKPKQQQ